MRRGRAIRVAAQLQAFSRRSRGGATQDRARGARRAARRVDSRRRQRIRTCDCSLRSGPMPTCARSSPTRPQRCAWRGAARPVPPENYHLTLAFRRRSAELQARGVAADRRAVSGRRACTIRFDAYEYWREVAGRGGRCAGDSAGVDSRCGDAAARLRLQDRRAEPPLRAHVTLARKVAQAPVLQAMSAIRLAVRRHSVWCAPIRSGAQSVYTVVDTWPLLDETPIA